ncbi:MAG: hypothetical protein GY804_09620 [Alphaproteobacteria bacterium]|nr:hypothetical protein [Alphaproteobacteria bacterium]
MLPIEYKRDQEINGVFFRREIESKKYPNGNVARRAIFRCYCGVPFKAVIMDVKRGHTNSCGCYQRKRIREAVGKHLLTNHRLYRIFAGMKTRCYNMNDPGYLDYGKRGISICDEWLSDFTKFYSWAMANGYKDKLSIDRINNDGNYEPDNCRWVTVAQNNQNRSTGRLNWSSVREIRQINKLVPRVSIDKLARAYRVNRGTIHKIIKNKIWVI